MQVLDSHYREAHGPDFLTKIKKNRCPRCGRKHPPDYGWAHEWDVREAGKLFCGRCMTRMEIEAGLLPNPAVL